MENLTFVVSCVLIIAAIFIVALLFEKYVCHDRKSFSSTHYISYTAMFACMAGVLMLIEIPLFFAPGFYKLDLSEMPVLICAYVGDFANFVVGCTFILPASMIYHAKPGKKTALVGMAVGTLIMTVFGSAFNAIYLLPKFSELFGLPLDTIVGMGTAVNGAINSVSTLVLFAVVPFNLLKGVVVSALTFLLYKRISPILHRNDAKRVSRRAGSAPAAGAGCSK